MRFVAEQPVYFAQLNSKFLGSYVLPSLVYDRNEIFRVFSLRDFQAV